MPNALTQMTPAEIRQEITHSVIRDIHGPAGGEHEELDSRRHGPISRYLVGKLAPVNQKVTPHQSDGLGDRSSDESEDGASDQNALQATTLLPSSIGLSFCMLPDVDSLVVRVSFGTYEKIISDVLTDEKSGNPVNIWQRTPHDATVELSLDEGSSDALHFYEQIPELYLKYHVRTVRDKATKVVSLFLVNGQREEDKSTRDEFWLFQPSIEVLAKDGSAIFLERLKQTTQGHLSDSYWNETRSNAMRYRKTGEFAVGHGVSVSVERDGPLARQIKTSTIPRFEVAQQSQPTAEEAPVLKDLSLDMEVLGAVPDGEFTATLEPLVLAYEDWIDSQESRIGQPDLEEFKAQALAAIASCRTAVERLKNACRMLDENSEAAAAFRFANQAMALQRIRSQYALENRRGKKMPVEELEKPENRSWRLFQLAFMLLNLPGLADPKHPERSDPDTGIADLLWFPTGGGKTEAYLGVAAFTMAIRRLQGQVGGLDGSCGVTVLMRYTLRLLTLQQFQRASVLICACEEIRRVANKRGDRRWGDEPFRVGLWVGQKTTPNRNADSDEAVKQARSGGWNQKKASGTPLQLTTCPWCGSPISPGKHVDVETFKKGRCRTLIYCGDPMGDCLFSRRRSPGEGLPVLTVDEEIYRRLPTLLIATVDKFAQMPWRGETGMLFGRVSGRCPRHGFRAPEIEDTDSHPKKDKMPSVRSEPCGFLRPPDLIIQDELHLISGPLGTLVGLFESGIDELCSWTLDGVRIRPKVIASTATVRQAAEQIQGVFARNVEIFPPPVLDIEDNFFARSRSLEDKPGRLYLGICAPGMNIKGTLIRVYSAFLSSAQKVYERLGLTADPWMTLTGYFSSIRELGSMRRSCDDSVRSWVRNYDERGLASRQITTPSELTSRVASSQIPEILELLEVPFDPQAEAARKAAFKAKRKAKSQKPIDILLATNMISVGVDVGRLGLMVVAGQPKNTAEYIQATSRVGRAHPGIVCTVYNWARPRDLSHYEKFEHFHATFYQHVEALSVTSFSSRALDRGLTSLVSSIVRLLGLRYNGNQDAEKLDCSDPDLTSFLDSIQARAARVGGERAGVEFRSGIDKRLQNWASRIESLQDGAKLGYREERDGLTQALLHQASGGAWSDWTVLNSLRNVEPSVGLILAGQKEQPDE